jgi:type I restriction enzyme, R subunit
MAGDHRTALTCLKISWQLGVWFHRTFKDASFRSGPFVPPRPPADESADLKGELARLRSELDHHRTSSTQVAGQLASAERRLREAEDERSFWEQMAAEAEQAKAGLQQHLAALQAQAQGQSRFDLDKLVETSSQAAQALTLDEADTRKLIDEQLRAAGWTVDSARLTYGKGAQPQPRFPSDP